MAAVAFMVADFMALAAGSAIVAPVGAAEDMAIADVDLAVTVAMVTVADYIGATPFGDMDGVGHGIAITSGITPTIMVTILIMVILGMASVTGHCVATVPTGIVTQEGK